MARDESAIFGGTRKDIENFQADEARKRGAASPGGILSLLGELDYYLLIENLTRGPITEQQLMTNHRWWIFAKGTALASMVGLAMIMTRIALLLPGADVPYSIKYSFYLVVYAGIIFASGNMFMKYARNPDGAAWTAVKFALAGLSTGLIFTETLKSAAFMTVLLSKGYIAKYVYGEYAFVDSLIRLFFDSFSRSLTEEIAALLVCYISVGYFWMYFNKRSEYNREIRKKGQPYDLGAA